jgi:chaperonin cofactor prefoldin
MPQNKKDSIKLDKDIVQTLENIIDEVGDTTKSVFSKIGELFIKKSKETLTTILESKKVILKEKIRSREKTDEQEKKNC